jgi:hypothetical protein
VSDWTINELRAFNIAVVPETVGTFFGSANLPPPSTISPAILAHKTSPVAGLPTDDRLFFDLLQEVETHPPCRGPRDSGVTDFTAHLLHLLGYTEPNRYIRTQKHIPLFMCGKYTHANAKVCVMNWTSGIHLLVQEVKRYRDGNFVIMNPETQLIADAIAAFQFQNCRQSAVGLPTVDSAVIPGITMDGTIPTFYKIDLTKTLVDAVGFGHYPAQTTTVHKLIPPDQTPQEGLGIRHLNSRAVTLSCFEALKQFL